MNNITKKSANRNNNKSVAALALQNKKDELKKEKEAIQKKMKPTLFDGYTDNEVIGLDPTKYNQEDATLLIKLQQQLKQHIEEKDKYESAIVLGAEQIDGIVDNAEQLLSSSKCGIFQRGGELVHIARVPWGPKSNKSQTSRSDGSYVIREVDAIYLSEVLTRYGHWLRYNSKSESLCDTDCPERIAKHLISRRQWNNIPFLNGIIHAPSIRGNGTILEEEGYDEATCLMLLNNGYVFAPIPENPTQKQINDSKKEIDRLLDGFPFANEASKSVAISAILTALIRRVILTAPIHGITAPKMGSGKSLLCRIVGIVATGRPVSTISYANDENEEQKRLLSLLIEGSPVICYDNVEDVMSSSSLCSILTEQKWGSRKLGKSAMISAPTNALFLVNGNNLVFQGDISSRAVMCTIDPQVERPEERTFDVNLYEHVSERRSNIVLAALTIMRGYISAGKPPLDQNVKPFGRFEEWDDYVRNPIIWAGYADPCATRKEVENTDPYRELICRILTRWYESIGPAKVTIRGLIERVQDTELYDDLVELSGEKDNTINCRSLGKKFNKIEKRIEAGYQLLKVGTAQRSVLWSVKKVS